MLAQLPIGLQRGASGGRTGKKLNYYVAGTRGVFSDKVAE
jgi:hypothetical protein